MRTVFTLRSTFTLIMLTALCSAFGRTCEVSGSIYDKLTGGHLTGSLVELINTSNDSIYAKDIALAKYINMEDTTYLSQFRLIYHSQMIIGNFGYQQKDMIQILCRLNQRTSKNKDTM